MVLTYIFLYMMFDREIGAPHLSLWDWLSDVYYFDAWCDVSLNIFTKPVLGM